MSRLYTPDDALERLHPKLIDLIEHQKRLRGCAMKAVKAVAERIGTSQQWVRRITGRYGSVKVQAHQFFNVAREHVRMKRKRRKRANAPAEPVEACSGGVERSVSKPWGQCDPERLVQAKPALRPVDHGSGLPRP